MDIARPTSRKPNGETHHLGTIAAVALIGITVLLARLKPAAPTVERNLVWIAEVKRGEIARQVRASARSCRRIRWIAAPHRAGSQDHSSPPAPSSRRTA